jgi:hypothetical protein
MGETCSTHMRYEICIQILVVKPKGRDDLENLIIDGNMS